jgi:uncharacterized UBP type Zn finger protein
MTIEQVVSENLRELPTDKQQQVLDFVTFLKQQTTINLQSSSQVNLPTILSQTPPIRNRRPLICSHQVRVVVKAIKVCGQI